MAGYIRAEAERFKTKGLNTKVNKDILYKFKVKCKERGLVLNNVVEAFVSQYGKGRYKFRKYEALTKKYNGQYPSDHLAVQISVKF